MKKLGFTLAEVLLTMSIIGIVAALTAPTLINIMPNKDKMQTIKYQKLISEINADLLNNSSLYINGKWSDKEVFEDYDITDQKLVVTNKYAYFLMKNLEDVDLMRHVPLGAQFTTADGYEWSVETTQEGIPKSIMIDTDGTGAGLDKYGSSSNKYPDRFYFNIDYKTGRAVCDENKDPITCRYLKCPYYLNNRKLDYECINSETDKCACK